MCFKKGYTPWNKGKTIKPGSGLRKICPQCNIEFKARKYSVYCSRACRNKANPIEYTDERREKHRIACKGINSGEHNPAYGKCGEDSWTYGTKRSEEVRQMQSELKKGLYLGEDNPNWRGGKPVRGYPVEFSKELKTMIRKRYNFICQICGKRGFSVHHVDYDKSNSSEDNFIVLCRSCHTKTNYNRDYWEELLKEKMGVSV